MKKLLAVLVSFCAISVSAQWTPMGALGAISSGNGGEPDMAISPTTGDIYVSHRNAGVAGQAGVKIWDGSAWQSVGSDNFTSGTASYVNIAFNSTGEPHVVFMDGANGNRASVMKFDGTNWNYLGAAGFSTGSVAYCDIEFNSADEPVVVYRDASLSSATQVKTFNGSSWIDVGSASPMGATTCTYTEIAIDASDNYYVAMSYGGGQTTRVYIWNGATWTHLATGMPGDNAYYQDIEVDAAGVPYLSYVNYSGSRPIKTFKYTGGTWTSVGSAAGWTANNSYYPTVKFDSSDNPYCVYYDGGFSNRATVQMWDGAAWNVIGTQGFSVGNADNTRMVITSTDQPVVCFQDASVGGSISAYSFGPPPVSLGALQFNGGTAIVETSTNTGIENISDNGFTMEAWVKANTNTAVESIIRNDGDYNLYTSFGVLYAEVWDDGTSNWTQIQGPASFPTGSWTHVAFSWDGSAGNFYVNGTQTAGTISNTNTIAASANFCVGESSVFTNQGFDGDIDEVRIWTCVKSAADVLADMSASHTGAEGGLALFWDFSDASGTTVTDLSINGNDGTLANGPVWVAGVATSGAPSFVGCPPSDMYDSGNALGGPESTYKVRSGDIDGDGDVDIVLSGWRSQVETWINDGTGNFSFGTVVSAGNYFADLGDLDGDGDLDIAGACDNCANLWWVNDGAGNYSSSGQSFQNIDDFRSDIVIFDADNDGDNDIVWAERQTSDGTRSELWLNDGTGVFTFSQEIDNDIARVNVVAADVNNDGFMDVIHGGASWSPEVWLNDGTGTFTFDNNAGGWYARSIEMGDCDNDGDLDMFTYDSYNNFVARVRVNDGTGNFTMSAGFGQIAGSWNNIEVGDFDGDGYIDVYLAHDGFADEIYVNDGCCNFTLSALNSFTGNSFDAHADDYNGDGKIDIALGVKTGSDQVWLNNITPPSCSVSDQTVSATTTSGLCSFDPGINLANSECGVVYFVRDNSTLDTLAGPFPGTGAAMTLPFNITASATVQVYGVAGAGCNTVMSTTQAITVSPITDQTVSAGTTDLCPTNTGTTITIGSSQSGINYSLRDDFDDSVIDGPTAGTGGSIVFNTGALAGTTTFNVFADGGACTLEMSTLVTINVGDAIAPTGSNPVAVNVQCIGDVPTPDPLVVTDEADNCGTPTVTFISDVSDGNTCPEVITRTYRIDDGNGNTLDVTQTITVNDDTDPTASNPVAINVECIGDVPAADPLVVTDEADNCTAAPIVAFVSDVSDGLTCPETITRTYSVTDDCGNSINVTQTITVNDITDPVISGCPSNINLNADQAGCTAIASWTDPTATDNCTAVPVVAGSHSSGSTFNLGLTTVTFTATDDCGNVSTCQFDVTVANTLAAVFDSVNDALCADSTDGQAFVTITGGNGGNTFDWDHDGTGDNDDLEDQDGLGAGTYNLTVTDAAGCTATTSATINEPTQLVVNIDGFVNPSACGMANGSVDASATGGTAPYNYDWNSGLATTEDISGLIAGSYVLTVTDDNGCIASNSQALSDPAGPVITIDATTDNLCNGDTLGTIDATITGGLAPYIIDWDNDGTGDNDDNEDIIDLGAGTYNITVTDDNGCVGSISAAINEPTAITTAPTLTDVICNGDSTGTAVLNPTGGTGTLVEDWGITNPGMLWAGYHTYTVTDDNGCVYADSVEIIQPEAISYTDSTLSITCFGLVDGEIYITPMGGVASYLVIWAADTATSQTALAAGYYTFTIEDANMCTLTDSIEIIEPAELTISALVTNEMFGTDGSIDLTIAGGTAPFTFDWDNDGTGDNDDTEDLSGLAPGTYDVTVTDANGCTTTGSYTVDSELGFDFESYDFEVYPNPNQGQFIIDLGQINASVINITDAAGKLVYTSANVQTGQNEINLEGVEDGMYIITIISDNTKYIQRFVKK